MLTLPSTVLLRRGRLVESVHRVRLVITGPDGDPLAWSPGAEVELEAPVFLRSAAKPFQALPLVEDGVADAWGVEEDELAVACGSHGGEPGHLAAVGRLLGRSGAEAGALACGPHAPLHGPSAAALAASGEAPSRLHNNCSGKHAGMLLLARHHGWPREGYEGEHHPLQIRMASEVARWTGVPVSALERGVDGCGVVAFALPLPALARAFARFLQAARRGEPGPRRVAGAMTSRAWLVAGTGRLCTAAMQAGEGRLLAKVGAEGVYGAAWAGPEGVHGIALKVEDGGRRAAEVALVAALDALGATGTCGPRLEEALAPWRRPPVRNTRGEAVAHLEVGP